MKDTAPNPPELLLGTAMWGWTVPEASCFQLLDAFYAAGLRGVDGATNYPINKVPEDFRKSEHILQKWIRANGVNDLRITMKVGSLNNLRSPECNLSKAFLLFCAEEYAAMFGKNLETLMVHWDNRETPEEIAETLEALSEIVKMGYGTGLSGIRHPEIYKARNERFKLDFSIQMKHNFLQSDYVRYEAFHGQKCFYAYGINAGGLKLNAKEYDTNSSLHVRGGDTSNTSPLLQNLCDFLETTAKDTPIQSLNHLGMLHAFYHPDMAGLLIGVSSLEQLTDSLTCYKALCQHDYRSLYDRLLHLQQSHA